MTQTFKIKLAAIAKDEGFYLPLWVYHHLHFGFDVLDIRINNNTDNSVAILENLKNIYGERVCFSFADKELAESKQQDVNFQTYIYGKILNETLKEDFTHLMFLDIDEYWCSANFTDTIKDFLVKTPEFDVCMFQWLMEMPDAQRKIDDFAFLPNLSGHRNAHVKSLANLKAPIVAVRAHNYIVPKGHYILPNKTIVNFSEDDQNRGIIPDEIYEKNRLNLEVYFIYHKIFRSQDEYVSSLLRGNKIDGDDSLLKTNRSGFIPTGQAEFNLSWEIDIMALAAYTTGYFQLIFPFKNQMDLARELVLSRKKIVLDYLKNDHFLQQINASKMLGLSADIYQAKENNYFMKTKVNDLIFDEQKLICSFDCVISSNNTNYELMITHHTSKVPLAATVELVNKQQISQGWIQKYHCTIPISELASLVYKRQPPFCLVAKLTESGEWLLLERRKFRSIAPTLTLYAVRFRKKQRDQAAKPLSSSKFESLNNNLDGFWRKLFKRFSGVS